MLDNVQNNPYYVLMADLLAENKDKQKINRINRNLDKINIEHFFDVCQRHDVTSIVYKILSSYYKKPLPSSWEEEYLNTKNRISFMLEKVRFLSAQLTAIGIPLVVLKNGGIAFQLMDDPALTPMGDIDTLVRKEDFRAAHELILNNGFMFRFRSEFEKEDLEKAIFNGGTEYSYDSECGQKMWLELSYRPIAGRWIRLDREPSADDLIKDSFKLSGTSVRVLSPEDNLLQVCIHTAKHSYVREPGFRLHMDVDRIVSRLRIDWDVFLEKVYATECKTAVYFSLYLSKTLFDTKIPDNILDKLRPRKRKEKNILKMIENANIMEPAEKKFSRISFFRFQLLLYDNFDDLFHIVIPSIRWLKKKYEFNSLFLLPFFICVRIFDLTGFRRRKSK